jgi:actin related protein 2/3 complex subunit 5
MVRNSTPEQTINKLSSEESDVCMRYIYKGLESPDNANALLKWHELVYKKEGLGTIVRALTYRQRKAAAKSEEPEDDD